MLNKLNCYTELLTRYFDSDFAKNTQRSAVFWRRL